MSVNLNRNLPHQHTSARPLTWGFGSVLLGCNRKSEREFYLFTISVFDIKGCSLLNMNRTHFSSYFFSAFRASYIPAFLFFVLCSSGFHFPIYVFLPVFLFLSVSPFLCLSVCLSVCLSLSVSLSVSVCLSLCAVVVVYCVSVLVLRLDCLQSRHSFK